MIVIYIMLPVSLLLAGFFLVAYLWSARTGQFEDTETPAMRMLADDRTLSTESDDLEAKNEDKPT
jgi:cbb3-type cytochrome oxidase maturation protein